MNVQALIRVRAVGCVFFLCTVLLGGGRAASREMPTVFEADFEDASLDAWRATDPKAWRIEDVGGQVSGNKALTLSGKSRYKPPARSPYNINLVEGVTVGSFVLDLRALSTTRDYAHRDLCLFFGYQDPSHFYYVHIANKADANAHSIFVVDGRPRVSIAKTRTQGIRWEDAWHRIRLTRNVETGAIAVFFDDMTEPIMTAADRRFEWGQLGVGSFDDTGSFDDVRLRGVRVEPRRPTRKGRGVKITEQADVLRVEMDGGLFTEYHYKDRERPYFYPVIGPTGANLTRHWPMKNGKDEQHDHRHHRSLWYTHGDVNGHDFWSAGKGPRIVHERFVKMSSGQKAGTIVSENRWAAKDGRTVCTDVRRHVFRSRPGCRIIDFEITIRASHGEVILGDTKEGSMAIRVAPTMRVKGKVAEGHILNSQGDRDRKTWGKRARWCDYYGPLEGRTVGIAIFDHPRNPRHPTWWHVRDYGLFAANPFGVHYFEKKPKGTGDMKIPAGGSATFRYRLYFHEGDTEEGRVKERYREYAGGR